MSIAGWIVLAWLLASLVGGILLLICVRVGSPWTRRQAKEPPETYIEEDLADVAEQRPKPYIEEDLTDVTKRLEMVAVSLENALRSQNLESAIELKKVLDIMASVPPERELPEFKILRELAEKRLGVQ